MASTANGLNARQSALLDEWLGEWMLVEDFSWPLQDTTVLRVRTTGDSTGVADHTVKASETSHHIGREIAAHRDVIDRLCLSAPRLEFADESAGILVTDYLPGELLLGTPWQSDVGAFEQAGDILARLQVPGAVTDGYLASVSAQTEDLLGRADGLVDSDSVARLRERLGRMRLRPVHLHFTHGDYQPRNWLVNDGRVAVIDFGRGAQRSWVSDLVRLRSKDFHEHPDLETAFMAGMRRELDEPDAELLALETLREAIGTVVWSHGIGDDDFEEHGRIMIRRFLDDENGAP
jgi:tRNA A-37 threonylcarbamoyl transferase component Bud32